MNSIFSFSYNQYSPLERMQQAFLEVPPKIKHFCIAFSGGLDSHVLLHATKQLFSNYLLTAIHINHELQYEALTWEKKCLSYCQHLEIPLRIHRVGKALKSYQNAGYSPEESARKARYAALTHTLTLKDCLLTGHHVEDQAETMILHLMRGTGIQGLKGMQQLTSYGNTYHLRPLLHWKHSERLAYAREHRLQWISDPSNHNQQFRRNFVRQTVLPCLQQKWANPAQLLARTATHCAEINNLCIEVAIADLSYCQIAHHQLSIQALFHLSPLRRRNVLRYWLYHRLGYAINTIQFNQMTQLLSTTKNNVSISLKSVTIKRYRASLYLLLHQDKKLRTETIQWSVDQPIELKDWGTLIAIPYKGEGIRTALFKENTIIEIRFRKGGERLHPKQRSGSHPLKKLFQEWGIPPWKRREWPLLYYNNELIAVPGCTIAKNSAARADESGLWISAVCSV